MPIPGADGSLYFASGIDNTGLIRGRKQAVGIIKGMTSQISKQDVFAGLAISATVAFSKVSKEMKQFSQDFEQSMREVETISKAVQGDFGGYSQSIIDLSKEVPQAAGELSAAYYQIVSAGYDGAAGLNLLDVSARAAVGGVTDVKTAADGLTSVMNAWKISAEDSTRVADSFFQTVKLGKTTMGELASNISKVAPLAASFGVSFEEIAAAVATLTKSGTPTAEAMTQIRASLIALNEKLGQGWGEAMSFQEALGEVAKRAKEAGKDIKQFIGTDEAALAILGLTGENLKIAAEDLKSYADALGVSTEAFEKMIETSINQSKVLKNNLKAILKPLGDYLAGKSTEFAKKMNEAFESGRVKEFAKFIGIATASLVAYKLTANGAALTTQILQKAIFAATRAFSALKIATINNPIGLLMAAATTAAAAFATFRKSMDDITRVNQKFNDEISKDIFSLNSVFEALKDAKRGTEEWNRARETINTRYGKYLENLLNEKSTLEDIEKAQKRVTQAIIANSGVKIYQEELEQQWSRYQEKFKKELGTFTEAFSKFKGADRLPDFVTAINEGIDKAIEQGGGQIERGMLEYSQIAKDIYTEFVDDISRTTGYVKWDPGAFTEGFLDLAEFKAKEADTNEYLQGMVDSFQQTLDKLFSASNGKDGKDDKLVDTKQMDAEVDYVEDKAWELLGVIERAAKEGRDALEDMYQDQIESLRKAFSDSIDKDIEETERKAEQMEREVESLRMRYATNKEIYQVQLSQLEEYYRNGIITHKEYLNYKEKLTAEYAAREIDTLQRGVAQIASSFVEMFDSIDKKAAESLNHVANLVDDVINAVKSYETGDVAGLVSSVLSGVSEVNDLIQDLFSKQDIIRAEQIQINAERLERGVENINRALEEQYNLLNKLEGMPWLKEAGKTIDTINQSIANLEQAMRSTPFRIEAPIDPMGDLSDPNNYMQLDTTGWTIEDFERTLKEYADIIRPETRAAIQEYIDQIKDLREEIVRMIEEIKIETIGFDIDYLTDSVMNMFETWKGGAIDFATTFEDVMKQAMYNMFQQRYVTAMMEPFYEQLYEALSTPNRRDGYRRREDGYFGFLSEEETAQLQQTWENIFKNLGVQWQDFVAFAEGLGMNLGGMDQDPNSLAGAIRKNLTEETGSILAGTMKTIMLDVRELKLMQHGAIDHLQRIEQNTSFNHYLSNLDAMRQDLNTLKNQLMG